VPSSMSMAPHAKNGTTATALDAHWWIACSVDQDVAKGASSAEF
jgi:hypothetical protein